MSEIGNTGPIRREPAITPIRPGTPINPNPDRRPGQQPDSNPNPDRKPDQPTPKPVPGKREWTA